MVTAQAADHATEAAGKTPPRVNKLTALHPPCVLADKYLGQFHFYHAGIAKQRNIPDQPTGISINRSLLAGNGVYSFSAPVPTAVNDKLLPLLIQLNFIDALPLEAQNIPLDVDSHYPVLCKVSEALYTNRLRGDRHPFSLIEAEKSHKYSVLSNIINKLSIFKGRIITSLAHSCRKVRRSLSHWFRPIKPWPSPQRIP